MKKAILYLFFFTALVMTVLGVATFIRAAASQELRAVYTVYAILMLGDALAMLLCGLFLDRRRIAIFWFAVIVLWFNIFPTIFDQFGLADLLYLLLNVITLGLLLFYRREFLPQ